MLYLIIKMLASWHVFADPVTYGKATIFELLNLGKLAMTHEMLNLLALNVRSKVTLYSSKSI